MAINKDYGYCTGMDCPIREECKRYSLEAINSPEPLWWTDGYYDEKKKNCEFKDDKNETSKI